MNGDTGAPTKGESQQPAMQPEKEEMKKSSGIEERQRRCENEVYVSLSSWFYDRRFKMKSWPFN